MERLSRIFLAFLKLYKFLGNICSFEQLFYKKKSCWVPLRIVQVKEKCFPPRHSVDSADTSFLGLHINFSDQIILKPNPCNNCLILSRYTKKSARADSGPGVTVIWASRRFGHTHSPNPGDIGIPVTLTQIANVIWEGDAHITRVLEMGVPKTGDSHITVTPVLGGAWLALSTSCLATSRISSNFLHSEQFL